MLGAYGLLWGSDADGCGAGERDAEEVAIPGYVEEEP